jgi:hypothetical protein
MESVLAEKLAALRPVLDERQWRLLLGAEAQSLGHGGIARGGLVVPFGRPGPAIAGFAVLAGVPR